MLSSSTTRLHGYLITAQLAFAGFQILSRVALANGTHALPFTFYRNCFASLLLGALSFFFEREQKRPTLRTLLYFFVLGFIGVTVNQVCYLTGLKYTSAIFASAMRNSTPVFTFAIAALFRIEKVDVKRPDGQLKVFGALLGLCGSLILSIYRGPVLIESSLSIPGTMITEQHVDVGAKKTLNVFNLVSLSLASWQIGAVFLAISCAAFGLFLILQAPVLESYPAPISFAAFSCFSSVIQIPLMGLAYEHEWSSWKPTSASEVIAISYAGVIGSGLVASIQSWGVLTHGPVIVAAYQPLETIFTALFSMIFLKEDLHLGSVVGGLVVVIGLYSLIWGQRKADSRQLPQTSATQVPDHLQELKDPFRRYSCDLETLRKKEIQDQDSALAPIRRHSLAIFSDLHAHLAPQRRLSETFQMLFRGSSENVGSEGSQDNQHLLP